MRGKSFIILLLFLVPALGAGIIGYGIGHRSHEDAEDTYQPAGDATFQSASYHDSVSTLVSASRQNAITRTVANVSPAVVGINVIEVRTVRYRQPLGR